MGVNLTPIIVRHPTTLQGLRGKSVAVDGNLELYQFLSIMRTRDGRPLMDPAGHVTSHLNGLIFRTTRLISEYQIRPVFVFDGPPPELKRAEIAKRREARQQARAAYEAAVAAGDMSTAWSKAVTSTTLTREMVHDAQTLLILLGIPWVQAPSEGEAQAAFLAARGDVWAAGSKDYDSLLFGAPRLVRYLAIASTEFLPSQGRTRKVSPEIIDLQENLAALELSREQLVDAAILVGTDFFPGIQGFGPKTAVKRIREWGSLRRAAAEIGSQLPENVEEIREFFLKPPVESNVDLRYRPPQDDKVLQFLCEERGFSRNRIEAILPRLHAPTETATTLDDFNAATT